MESLQAERLTGVQGAIGTMEYVLNITLQYISERKAFDPEINKFQVLRHQIADMATEFEAYKSFTHQTSYRMAH